MKSLRSMKALQAKYLASRGEDDHLYHAGVALLDGGATHALRRGSAEELANAEPVQVELAHGSTMLWKRKGSMTLLSREEVEPIIPLRMLVENGYMLKWSAASCEISHPDHGKIRCWRRSGCPVMNREEALNLLSQLENMEKGNEIDEEEQKWWAERYPKVPAEVWLKMMGQGKDWRTCEGTLPWNRRQRKRMESRGVILHIFAGGIESSSRWKDLENTGYEIVVLDVLRNGKENLHSPAVWAYLWELAERGLIRMIYGGPPCRSTSRLRHRLPGPRPVRGRDERRFGLEGLTEAEEEMVVGDTALIFKLLGLYEKTVEVGGCPKDVGFLMEHPADPLEYMEEQEGNDYPSIWEWEEIQDFLVKFGLVKVSFDQGGTGHSRRKPTTLLTNLEGLQQLEGISARGTKVEPLEEDLQRRMRQTSSWASWSPGLVSAVKVAIREFVNKEGQLKKLKMSIEDWRKHVAQNHIPYRRDCRLCIERMGQDCPHRRRKPGGEMVYNLSVDLIGPFCQGWDYGRKQAAKYGMAAMITVPKGETMDLEKGLEDGLRRKLPLRKMRSYKIFLNQKEVMISTT